MISLQVCERTFYEKRDTSSTPESVSETAISIPLSTNNNNLKMKTGTHILSNMKVPVVVSVLDLMRLIL